MKAIFSMFNTMFQGDYYISRNRESIENQLCNYDKDFKRDICVSELKRKNPLQYLHDESLKTLLETATTSKHKKKDELFNIGDNDTKAVFLIRGSLILESVDRCVTFITHSHNMAQFPLANLKPRLYKATATSDETMLFWIDNDILELAISGNDRSQEIAITYNS